jgi:hypothetical protein
MICAMVAAGIRVQQGFMKSVARHNGESMADAVHGIMDGRIFGSESHKENESGHGKEGCCLEVKRRGL